MTSTNTSQERREKHKIELRSKILDAARELIVDQGVDQFSMRKLAAKIGYTATAIYFHFADKETLIQELVDLDFIKFREQFDGLEQKADPIERIRLMGLAFVSFFSRNLKMVPSAKVVTQGNPAEDNYCLLKSTVEAALAQNRFREELRDSDEICQILMAVVHGVVSNHICREAHPWIEFRPVEQTAQSAITAVIRGLLRQPEEMK